MCVKGREKRDRATLAAGVDQIDWARIPLGYNEVRKSKTGSLWASPHFRVLTTHLTPYYRDFSNSPVFGWHHMPVVATRPTTLRNYLIQCPGVYPQIVLDVTKDGLQDHLTKAGYGPDIHVYELTLVAEAKKVEVKTIETQLVWSK